MPSRSRPRRDEQRKMRLARQYARQYRRTNPGASPDDIAQGVKAELQSDFPDDFGEGFDWITFLPQLLDFIKAIMDFFSDSDE
jgi:hypothetical protein